MLLSAGKDEVAILRGGNNCWLQFSRPHAVVQARDLDEVSPALALVENLMQEKHWHAVGFLAYEAAPAFVLPLRYRPCDAPLLWFGLYSSPRTLQRLESHGAGYQVGPWQASISSEEYLGAIEEIKKRLAAGEASCVNFTYLQRSAFSGDPAALFAALARAHAPSPAAYIETSRFAVCSVSPELFFHSWNGTLVRKPIRGSVPRGLTVEQDAAMNFALRSMDRTENDGVLDALLGEMARIPGARRIRREPLPEVQRYQSQLQMTSTLAAESHAPFSDLIRALFPCATLTGVPKAGAAKIIRDLERFPRGIFTGCIGAAAPRGGPARFHTATRTVWVDKSTSRAEFGVGARVTADSQGGREYQICQRALHIVTRREPEFSLVETLGWTPQEGYFLRWYHLARLRRSAEYFMIEIDWERLNAQLDALAETFSRMPHKIRLLVTRDGAILNEAEKLPPAQPFVRIGLAASPVDSQDRFLYHRTTHRGAALRALASRPDCDDVILWNERGEVTETCHGNIVISRGKTFFTPRISAGLLRGTFRQWLLDTGVLHEDDISIDEVRRGPALYVVNSVRRWRPGLFVPAADTIPERAMIAAVDAA